VVLQEIGPSSTPITATTGNDGKFQFTNLPPAPVDRQVKWYELVVSKSQRATVRAEVPVWKAETVRMTLVQQQRDPSFASDDRLPTLSAQGHTGDPSKYDVSANDEAGGSGLRFVGWLMDYDWGHVQGRLLNGAQSYADTLFVPNIWDRGPGEHTVMFVAMDRAGNTVIDSSWSGPPSTNPPQLDTPPNIVGAVANTITNSFLDIPPTLAGASVTPMSASSTPNSTPSLLQWVSRAVRQAGGQTGGQAGSNAGEKRVQPAALPPGSNAFLFTTVGWRQANLTGVTGFRVYRNGRFAFDHRTTNPEPNSDIYRTDDFAAELVPGQTSTYTVSAFGLGKESATSVSRSVVPLALLSKPAPLSPGDAAVLDDLPTLQWTSVAGQSVSYLVEILAPGMSDTEFWEVPATELDLYRAEPPTGYSNWPAGTYSWRPLAARTTPDLGTLTRPWYDYQAVSLAAGGWRTFTLTSAQ